MRIPVRITQLIVGILFIISGLVKANDPMGLSYKMQEFFEIWSGDLGAGKFFARNFLIGLFDFLHDYALLLSVLVITLEIVAGAALLLGTRKKGVLWMLLILILFFTFLTGFAYLSTNPDGSPKFTNCGCFGDCLPISPAVSFIKDLALLVLILFLLIGHNYIKPVFTRTVRGGLLALTVMLSLGFQWYVLRYLPVVDCLPFKEKNNIAEQMNPPAGSVPDLFETRLVYQNTKTGEAREMSQDEFNDSRIWEDPAWEWKETKTKLVKKGNADPPIKGFSLTDSSGQDHVQKLLAETRALLFFALDERNPGWLDEMEALLNVALEKNIPVYFATASRERFTRLFAGRGWNVPVYASDFTVIRTAARTNPTLYLLQSGTIEKKFSNHQLDAAVQHIKSIK